MISATDCHHSCDGESPGQCVSPLYAVASASARRPRDSTYCSHAVNSFSPRDHAAAENSVGRDAANSSIGFHKKPEHVESNSGSRPMSGPMCRCARIRASFTGVLSQINGRRPPVTRERSRDCGAVMESVTTVSPVHITSMSSRSPVHKAVR